MDTQKLLEVVQSIKADTNSLTLVAKALEFLRIHAGEGSSLFVTLQQLVDQENEALSRAATGKYHGGYDAQAESVRLSAIAALDAFVNLANEGVLGSVSVQRQAQIDVVSDYLEQAQAMLEDENVHPAAPAVLIGASLEEFLRNWAEEQDLTGSAKNPGMDTYAGKLKQANLITKQDAKDITSWGGLRNAAAHGEFDQIQKESIGIMLQGVNLFMRKYSERS